MTSRRQFIQSLGFAAATVFSFGSICRVFGQSAVKSDSFLSPEGSSDLLAYLTRGHFEAVINSSIQVEISDNYRIHLELIEVKDLRLKVNISRGYTGESFSLLFQSSRQQPFPQDTYAVTHTSLGEFSLFIVPVGQRGDRYEAIVNRFER